MNKLRQFFSCPNDVEHLAYAVGATAPVFAAVGDSSWMWYTPVGIACCLIGYAAHLVDERTAQH